MIEGVLPNKQGSGSTQFFQLLRTSFAEEIADKKISIFG